MPIDTELVRAEFPALERRISGKPLIYLDSAATSLKPRVVLEAEQNFYLQGGANVHRGKHALSEESSESFEAAREDIAGHLNAASPREIVFVANATQALNMVAYGLKLKPDDEIIAAPVEHHSNLVPWLRAAKVRWVEAQPFEPIDPRAVKALIGPRTRAVVVGHASNVSGLIQPVRDVCAIARECGVVSVVDAAQSVPHLEVDVQDLGCDFLAFSGHKALGPMGIGVLYGREEALLRLEPMLVGGGTVEKVDRQGFVLRKAPLRFEAGTPNAAGAVALAAALRFVRRLGFGAIAEHDERLAAAMEVGLQGLPGVQVVMARTRPRLPICSLVFDGSSLEADHLALLLSDRHAIMTRSGFHCAHPLFDAAGWKKGALRASAHVYNTAAEVQSLCYAVRDLAEAFAR